MTFDAATSERSDADVERILDQIRRFHRPVPKLPRWLPLALAVLPFVLISVTIINGLLGVIAIMTPFLAAGLWVGGGDALYQAYALICPQRADHTFFLSGYPMAFEQRDLAMHLSFALTGLLYLRARFLQTPLATPWLVAGLAPMLIDVVLSTVDLLPATALSRTWTGALASFVIVWWSYPRFEAMHRNVVHHVEQIRRRAEMAQPGMD